jgi:hypothetical protein
MKTCPKCQSTHNKLGVFCSRACANSRTLACTCLFCGAECKVSPKRIHKYCSIQCHQDHILNVKIDNGTASLRTLKRFLIKTYGNKCSNCGITEWNKKPIVMDLEHIDGDGENNKLNNLCLLCPNCHSQTDTYKGKNRGNGRHNRMKRYYSNKSY